MISLDKKMKEEPHDMSNPLIDRCTLGKSSYLYREFDIKRYLHWSYHPHLRNCHIASSQRDSKLAVHTVSIYIIIPYVCLSAPLLLGNYKFDWAEIIYGPLQS